MSFLLDTNICSAYLRGDGRVFNRFIQHSGGLSTSAIVAGELYSWAHRARTNPRHVQGLNDLLSDVQILPVDQAVAQRFGAASRRFAPRCWTRADRRPRLIF